jgi:hypothetical protein
VHLDREQLSGHPAAAAGALAKHAERVVAWLAANGGTFAGNKGERSANRSGCRTAFFEAFSTLEGSNRVRVENSKRTGPRISLNPGVKT